MTVIILISLIILIIWLVTKRKNLEHKEEINQISGELRVKYPNFVKAIRIVYGERAKLLIDNNKALCYKAPIMTFNRLMGDILTSIIDTTNIGNKPYIITGFKGNNGVDITTERYYLKDDIDLSTEQYLEIFDELAKEILSDSRYLKSITY